MTIKQNGGIFGRNPTFNDVTIEGELTFDGDIDVNSDLKVGGDLEVTGPDGRSITLKNTNGGAATGDLIGQVLFYGSDASSPGAGVKSKFKVITDGGSADGSKILISTSDGVTNDIDRMEFTKDGDVKVLTGNLVIGTSGKGIDFSATSGTGTSELFDDYEEGTWTPTLVGSTSAGTATFVTGPTGIYTKIGNQVTVYFDWNISAHTGTGALRVTGLPFAKGAGVGVGTIMDGNYTYSAGRTKLVPYVVSNSILRIYQTGSGVGYIENVLDTSHQINGSVTYTV